MDSGKFLWKDFFRMFAVPVSALALMAIMVHLSDNLINPGSPYEGTFQPVRAWTAIWVCLFFCFINLFPIGSLSGGKITSVLFGSKFTNLAGLLAIIFFALIADQLVLGIILIIFHGAYIYLYKARQPALMTKLQKITALIAYPAIFTLSFLYLAISASKVGQLETPRSVRKDAWVSENGLVDVRGQIHVHCNLSKDSDGTLEEISKAARANKVHWIIMTDHTHRRPDDEHYPDKLNDILFIYGTEHSNKCDKCERDKEGSRFRASLKDDRFTLNLFGHIEKFDDGYDDPVWDSWDAIELVNVHANCFEKALDLAAGVFGSPSSIYASLAVPLDKNLYYWQELAERERRPIPIFCAPDAHQNVRPLRILLDPYELMLGLFATHIWLNEGEELNQANIFSAIKNGRTYIAFEYLGDASGFQFWADGYGGEKYFTGSTPKNAEKLFAKTPLPGTLKIYRDNILVKSEDGNELILESPGPGFWRIEVERDGKPWIMSGQILVK